jgi:asparagine synthase (glutamine-hydrolysing)
MCGILGVSSANQIDKNDFMSALSTIIHRGRNNQDFSYLDKHKTYFGHTRLSIIDTSDSANQPMWDSTGQFLIVFNGEVYNFEEIRLKIQNKKNIVWKSLGDTEVIIEAYALWGKECVAMFRGCFAFSIYDSKTGDIFMVRDRLGVKPLYYFHDKSTFVFASEIRPFEKLKLIKELNKDSFSGFLRYGSFVSEQTPYKDIRMLEPGHSLYYRKINNTLEKKCYWSIDWSDKYDASREEILKKIQNELLESVSLRLNSDVPLGIFLSGGIDSSAMVSLAKEFRSDIDTFSVVYEDDKYSEKIYIDKVVKRFGTNHHEIRLGYKDLLSIFEQYESSLDIPSVDGLNTFLISHYTKKAGITTALSGLGGDELFAGYPMFVEANRVNAFYSLTPYSARRQVGKLITRFSKDGRLNRMGELLQKTRNYAHYLSMKREIFSDNDINDLLGGEVLSARMPSYSFQNVIDPIDQVSAFELSRYMPDTLLRDGDNMSMSAGLEIRFPLIDHKLVEALARTPSKYKIDQNKPKNLLVDALPTPIPDECIYRPKMGFTLPLENWLRKEEIINYMNLIMSGNSNIVNSSIMRKHWNRFLNKEPRASFAKVWALYSLQCFAQRNK